MSKLAILGGDPVRTEPFASWPRWLPSDAHRLQAVLESGHWGGFPVPSHYAAEFAERFAAMHGAKYALCIANGTIALIAALQAVGIRFGDEVIVPAYTWDGTPTSIPTPTAWTSNPPMKRSRRVRAPLFPSTSRCASSTWTHCSSWPASTTSK